VVLAGFGIGDDCHQGGKSCATFSTSVLRWIPPFGKETPHVSPCEINTNVSLTDHLQDRRAIVEILWHTQCYGVGATAPYVGAYEGVCACGCRRTLDVQRIMPRF